MRTSLILAACLTLAAPLPVRAGTDRHSGWTMLWNDEFDEPGVPNPDYWSHEVNCWGGGNHERQCYTDRLDNAYVGGDGRLHLVAKEEFYSGPALQDDHPDYPGPSVFRNYTSARLRTRNKVDWLYGRIEVRARVPGGKGMWPAIWMLPTDWSYGGWPSSGEIDIVEAVNLPREGFAGWGNVVHGTLHYGLPYPQWENHGRSYIMSVNPADDFHEYAIEWEADEIRWYVDGVHYQTQTSAGWYNYVWGGQDHGFVVATDRAPFDERFHLLLNVAVGGDWPGAPDSGWDEDREMLVDYVRVYQCAAELRKPADHRSAPRSRSGDLNQGRGSACRTVDPAIPVHEDHGAPGINEFPIYDAGVETFTWEVWIAGQPTVVENTLVPGSFASPGVIVESEPAADGPWEIEFRRTGSFVDDGFVASVSLSSADMSGVEGIEAGFNLYGGSGWTENGELEFEIKIESIDPASRLFVKMNSGESGLGLAEIEVPAPGRWRHVSVRLSDLVATRNPGEEPLDMHDILSMFVLESTGPVHLWLDDIRLQCTFNTEPESWQIDKFCGVAPRN